VSQSAREVAEASIRAAKEATEASKKGAEEAAEAWTKVFNELIAGTEGIGKMIKQVARQTAEAPARRWQEGSKTNELGPKEVAETLTPAFEQMTSGAEGTNLKEEKEEALKTQMGIENRLESLTRMFAADKDEQAEEDTEEEES